MRLKAANCLLTFILCQLKSSILLLTFIFYPSPLYFNSF